MSKSTKIIAALGVAAGLGVAALPAATFADTTVVVPLAVTIEETLSLSGVTTGDFASTSGITLTAGQNNSASKTVLTAISNNGTGWKVTVAGTDDETQQSGSTLYNATTGGQSIAPFSSKVTDLDDNETSGWGIKLSDLATGVTAGDFTTDGWTGVSSENDTVVASSAPSGTGGKTFTANYGIDLADTQASGTYKGSITYTIAKAD